MAQNPNQVPSAVDQAPDAPPRGALFPANQKEAKMFINNLISLIHQEETTDKIIESISSAPTMEEGIAAVLSMILSRVILSIRDTQDRDVNIKFILQTIKPLTQELYALLAASGNTKTKPTSKFYSNVAKLAGDQLQQMLGRAETIRRQQKEYETQNPGSAETQESPEGGEVPSQEAPSALGGM